MALGSMGRIFVEIGAVTKGLEAGIKTAEGKVAGLGAALDKHGVAIGAVLTGIGFAANRMSSSASDSFYEFETAMAGVRKTTGMSKGEIAGMGDAFIDLSKTMPTSAAQLASIGMVAGQLGISGKENILTFTKTVATMSTAFDMSEESAATAMAKMANIYDIPIAEISRLGSAINVLGNTTAAKESQIMDFSMSLGAAARMLGFSAQESVAMGATLIAMGMDASDAGSRLNSAFTQMGAKSAEVAEFLGMTDEEFRKAFGENPMAMLTAVTTKLGQIQDPLERNTVAADMFGRVGAKAINALGGDLEGLQINLANANKGFEENKSLLEEYTNATDTYAAQQQILQNKSEAAGIAMGKAMAPAKLAVSELTVAAAGLIEALPEPMQTAAGMGLMLSESFMALGPLLMGISMMGPGVTGAFTAMAGGVRALNLAFLGNPVVLAIMAIIAVLALIYLAWTNNWGGIQEKTKAVFDFLKDIFSQIVVKAAGFISNVITWLAKMGDKLLFLLGPIGAIIWAFKNWNQIRTIISQVFNAVFSYLSGLYSRFRNAGSALINAFKSGITSKIYEVVSAVKNGLNRVRNLLPFSDAREGPLSDLTKSGAALIDTFTKGMQSAGTGLSSAFQNQLPAVGAGELPAGPSFSVQIQTVNLSRDYDFNRLMADIENFRAGKRVQRGIVTL